MCLWHTLMLCSSHTFRSIVSRTLIKVLVKHFQRLKDFKIIEIFLKGQSAWMKECDAKILVHA